LTLTFQSLCSGSSGNSLLLKTDGSALLLDAGFPSMRAGRKALNGCLSEIKGAVISHLHSDHIQYSSLRLLEENRIPIYLYERDIQPLASRHFRQSPFLHLKLRPFSDRPFIDRRIFHPPLSVASRWNPPHFWVCHRRQPEGPAEKSCGRHGFSGLGRPSQSV
jgi:glyoxylase-like metal-dependent hydrolase (beta-lactamase superfamily II)